MDTPADSTSTASPDLPEVISREDLYALVWAEPMQRLAKRFGLSDVGLAKACRRMMVPVPGRGYWQQKEVGRAPKPTRLPMLPAKARDDVRQIRVQRRRVSSAAEIAAEPAEKIVVTVADVLRDPHPLVVQTVKAFRGGKSQQDGYLHAKAADSLAIDATMGTIDRAMRIYDAMLKAVEARGCDVEIRRVPNQGNPHAAPEYETIVLVDGEEISVRITETLKRITHPSEMDGIPKEKRPYFIPGYPKFEPTGQLAISIVNAPYGSRGRWADGVKQTVETLLGAFIQGLGTAAIGLAAARRESEERERRWQEERRQRELEEERLRAEAGRIRALDTAIDRMHQARYAREYVEELKAAVVANPDANTPEMQAWISWADQYALRIDPMRKPKVPKDPKPYGY